MSSANKEDACPVDHKTRDAWLSQARAAEATKSQAAAAQCPVDHTSQAQSKSWTQVITSYMTWTSASTAPVTPEIKPRNAALTTDRVISTIPRSTTGSEACPVDHGASANAPNAEIESGVDASGNWVYPSEKMFFDAMKRKGYDARVADMKTVVPIHNAVNERAWQQIKEWEAPYLSKSRYVSKPFGFSLDARSVLTRGDCQLRRAKTRILRQQKRPHDADRPYQHHPRVYGAF